MSVTLFCSRDESIASVRSRWLKWGTHQFSVIWHCWHWYQHHVMPMAFEITPMDSLGQDNWKNVQHNIFGHDMPLVLLLSVTLWQQCNQWHNEKHDFDAFGTSGVAHDATGIINGTIAFIRSTQLKLRAASLFWSYAANGVALTTHNGNGTVNGTTAFIRSDDWNAVQHDFLGHVTLLALASAPHIDVISGTTAFLRYRWLKWDVISHIMVPYTKGLHESFKKTCDKMGTKSFIKEETPSETSLWP